MKESAKKGKMAKITSQYVCQSCGATTPKWAGRCDACGAWNTIVEEQVNATPKGLKPGKSKGLEITSLADTVAPHARASTGIAELDRVLGGGLVEGSAILLGGDPGIGKSTLLLQAAATLSKSNRQVLYVSGEESLAQIQLRSQRLGLAGAPLQLATATSVRDILASVDQPRVAFHGEPLAAGVSTKREGGTSPPSEKLDVLIIDSIQTMYVDNIESAPGTVAQVRAATHELIRAAKKRGFSLILVGHVTKDGQIAGPRVLEHMVDTVLYFEGDRGQYYRILRAVKNRFGATDEIGVFAMNDSGLEEVKNPSALFLHDREHPVSGAAVFAGMEGTRPLLAEIQALVSQSGMSTPRRATVGFDGARLAMILAVLETRAGMRFSDKEVFLNVAGGLKLSEPAADVAASLALISALLDKPLPSGIVSFGEIGLTGEIRAVSRAETRLKEAKALGFTRGVIPSSTSEKNTALHRVERVAHVDALVKFVLES
jgi:DNA repair protein RadA/Sms